MRAALYARKSTDDNDRNADNKSVTRQVEHAKAYAAAKGWTVDDEHIYIDDGISGAEFKNRPALLRMLNRLREFNAIIMSELSRLGREQSQTSNALASVAAKGVRVFFYLTDEELKFDTAIDKFMVSAASFAAELEREKASQRARDALLRKAERGYNTGGVVYGYDNLQVMGTSATGEQVRTHTDYRINADEAEIIKGMFRAYADGRGLKTIARALNGDPGCREVLNRYFDGRTPPPPRKGTDSWAPSSIRAMLHRERYRGKVPFGKHRKVVRAGARTRERQDEYLLTERPDLRIVDEALWQQVQARLRKQAAPTPSAPRIRESKYLLSGLLRCGHCGSSMLATSMVIGTPRTRRSVRRYACSWANSRGSTVCQNNIRPRMDDLDAAVIDTIERQILTPAAVRRVIEFALEEARAELRTPPAQRDRRERELSKLRVELDRLIALVVGGKAPERVLAEIASREARIRELEREIQAVASESKSWNWQAMEGLIAQRAAHLRHVLHSETAAARSALVELLAEPMKFKPLGHREYEVSGLTRAGMLLETASEKSHKVASPRGFEPLLPP